MKSANDNGMTIKQFTRLIISLYQPPEYTVERIVHDISTHTMHGVIRITPAPRPIHLEFIV